MTESYRNRRNEEFRQETTKVAGAVRGFAYLLNTCSAAFAAGATYLHVSEGGENFMLALVVASLVGVMTAGALFTFTTAILRLLPRFDPKHQPIGGAIGLVALIAVCAISGTSNAVFLGYFEARAREEDKAISRGEEVFATAQTIRRQLEQIAPLLATGRETARLLKEIEERGGSTGAGKGPIHAELVTQESRLAGAEESIRSAMTSADTRIAAGQKVIADMRAAAKNGTLSREDRRRAIDNGLTRLASIVIELRQQMPMSSLDAIATMLRTPIKLPSWSNNAQTRQRQLETVARLQQEFEPVGIALGDAVRALGERIPPDVPVYRQKSPTAMVFSNAGDLAWLIAVGYSLDILPYLALGLILLAHRQTDANDAHAAQHDEDDRPPPPGPWDFDPRGGAPRNVHVLAQARRQRTHRPNGAGRDHRGA